MTNKQTKNKIKFYKRHMNGPESLKNLGTGENIRKERT